MSISGKFDDDIQVTDAVSPTVELFDAVKADLSRQKGRRDALLEREAELIEKVGEAKARIALKGDIEKFVSDIQQEAFGQATHSLETLLTSIVQEVLPTSSPIGLELGTERGLPALDISVVGPGGTREDIYEDHGGSLSNVVVMGLRLIAAVKAGGAKFLALDEPECWVMPERVPAFFDVLRDASARLGVQTIAITHHSASANFDGSVRVSNIAGHPKDGVFIESDFPLYEWNDDEEGFRWMRLVNFQAFADARWDLTPGLNALIGGNDLGKSCMIRAVRALFYGETRDKQVRHFTDGFTIQLGTKGNRYLQLTRELKRNPKNIWSLHEADGSIVVADGGKRLETGGKDVPEWVDRLWGITKQDDNETHIAHQKRPVYLIDKSNVQKASVLSIGQESAYTTDMLKIAKERVSADNATIKAGELEVGTIRISLQRMSCLDQVDEDLRAAEQDLVDIKAAEMAIAGINRHILRIKAAESALRSARIRQAAYADLPSPDQLEAFRQRLSKIEAMTTAVSNLRAITEALQISTARLNALKHVPEAAPALEPTDHLSVAIANLRRTQAALATSEIKRTVLSDVPEVPPTIDDSSALASAIKSIRGLTADLAVARSNKKDIEIKLDEAKATIDEALSSGGNRCPTCGQHVTAEELLHGHEQEQTG